MEKLPDYRDKQRIKFVVIPFIIFLSLSFQIIMDSLPRFFRQSTIFWVLEPFFPIFGTLIVLIIGFLLVYSFWRVRDKYLLKYGELAYQKGFKFVITGIPLVLTVVLHAYFPTDLIIPLESHQTLNWFLDTPITQIIFGFSITSFIIRTVVSLLFLGLGFAVILNAIRIFGVDYMGLVYVYYPDESTLQDHKIYSILRHPTYHGVMLLGIGSIFFRCSIYSIIYFLFFIIGINIHLKLVEERELIKRFGEKYKIYMNSVPALFVRLKDLKDYFRFIF